MKVLNFDANGYRDAYSRDGWVVIRNGVDPEFLEVASKAIYDMIGIDDKSMAEWEFAQKKRQFLFEFPDGADFPGGVYDSIASVTGLDRERLTLCERHVKVYDSKADPNPPPHKDRLASEVAVAIPISTPKDSHLVLFTGEHEEINPFQSTAEWNDTRDDEERPQTLLAGREPVRVELAAGDVLMFRGSALYHERLNGANSILLYLKLNSMRLDPIGEDPSTPTLEARSSELIGGARAETLHDLAIEISPRLEKVVRYYSRHDWREVLLANLWGQKPFRLSEEDFAMLRRLGERKPVSELLAECEGLFRSREDAERRIRRLVGRDALLLSMAG